MSSRSQFSLGFTGKDLSLLGVIFLLGENVPTWWPCPSGRLTAIGLEACSRQHFASHMEGVYSTRFWKWSSWYVKGKLLIHTHQISNTKLAESCLIFVKSYISFQNCDKMTQGEPFYIFLPVCAISSRGPSIRAGAVQSCGKEGREGFLSLTRRGDRFVLASVHIAAGMPSLESVLHASTRWHRSGAGVAQASCMSTNWWWRSSRAKGAQPSITASGFRWIPVWRESASLASRFSLGMSFWSPVISAPWRKSE